MKTITALAFASTLLVCSGASWAAAPFLHVHQSIEVDAPAGKVWKAIENFDGLNTWHPAVAKDEIVEGTNNTVGAVRLLTLKDGGTIKEKLLGFTPAAHSFRYAILEGVLPVTSYTSIVTVKSAGKGKSLVTWSGKFKRKNVADNPGDNENDKTAVDTITSVYQGGLQNLKKLVESGS
jgi:mxaD protein